MLYYNHRMKYGFAGEGEHKRKQFRSLNGKRLSLAPRSLARDGVGSKEPFVH
jgi:hypothetical protein